MRFIRLLGLGTILALGVGCGLIEKMKPNPRPTTPVQKVSAPQLVDYLNTQASRLQSITFDRATVTAKQGLISMPSLRGDLAACQPRNFRMRGQGGVVSAKIDLGSNADQFWMFVDAPTVRPTFVFASHSDFESGRARMPEGVPFEPDWVMQALGMTTFPRDAKYDPVKLDEKARTYTLSWPTSTPNGVPIRKEIVFLTEDADSGRGQAQVKRHVIRDARNRVICSADIKSAKTVSVPGNDPRSGANYVVQYPTHIVLHWETQNFNMDMMLDGAKVNPPLTPEAIRTHFKLPTNLGPGINLAEARFDASR
jgi:hypothetical protein